MHKFTALACLIILGGLLEYNFVHAARKSGEVNPLVRCAQKIDRVKLMASASVLALARIECSKNPEAFDALNYLARSPNAQCERKIGPLLIPNASVNMIQLARSECMKDPTEFNSVKFQRDFTICDNKARSMVALWKGFRKLARQECIGLDDPSEFSRSEFTKRNVNAPGSVPSTPN